VGLMWEEEFPSSFRVPGPIEFLVRQGALEETSWQNEASPSFASHLKDGSWVKLWTEHPNAPSRQGLPWRFTLCHQGDPSGIGEVFFQTEDLNRLLWELVPLLWERAKVRPRFRLTETPRLFTPSFPWSEPYADTEAKARFLQLSEFITFGERHTLAARFV
jgi:hypothetical protein